MRMRSVCAQIVSGAEDTQHRQADERPPERAAPADKLGDNQEAEPAARERLREADACAQRERQ